MTYERTTNYHDHVPIHRLNTPQTKLWLFGGDIRRRLASNLSKRYPSGVGVCSATLRLIAYVDPKGGFRELLPPHKKYEMYQISNKPLVAECQCASFFDPEVQGPWRDRGTDEHHPICQFERVSGKVFDTLVLRSPGVTAARLDANGEPVFERHSGAPALRPDEALKLREQLKW